MFKKFIQYSTGNFLALLLGFISSPIITRIISPVEMGKFSLFNTVTSLLFLFVMIGTDQSYVRFYNSETEESRTSLLRKCVLYSLLVGTGTSIALLVFYPRLSIYLTGKVSLQVVFLLILNIYSNILQRFSILEIRMALKAKLFSAMNVWNKLSYVLMVFAVYLWLKDNSLVLMIATVASNFLVFLACALIEHNVWFHGSKNKTMIDVKELIKYGFPFIFSNAVSWIFEYIDRLSIRQYCGFKEVGIYSAASTIVSLLISCQLAFTAFWVPVAYERYENDVNCKEFFYRINRIVSYGMIVVAMFMVAGKDILIYLLGSEYRTAMFIFPFLTFMPIMYTISETTVLGINFKKKTKMHIVIAITSALCNLIGNILLVPRFGATGAAISTGFSYIVFFIVRTNIAQKLYPVNYRLKSLYISMTLLCILAVYSSFHTLDIIIVIMAVASLAIVSIMYKDVVSDIIGFIKKRILAK